MTVDHHVGDCRDILPTLTPGTINLACTSPPFLGLRDYVGGDNEIGTEPTPADFLQSLLEVTALIGDVLTADGSIAVELGDTYASTGSSESANTRNRAQPRRPGGDRSVGGHHLGGEGWPLDKSMCMIPHSYALSLAYGRNILTGEASPAGVWRVRNVICWVRNPAPGEVGDKFRHGTSYITIATRGRQRYFDKDSVRDAEGVPPIDYQIDGDLVWPLAASRGIKTPISSADSRHLAMYPEELPRRLIQAMCPPGGVVLDPFVGSGTTAAAAQSLGRSCVSMDVDPRNVDLIRERVGMFLNVVE